MFQRDVAGLKMSLYCEDPTSVSTASAHLMSYGSHQTSYEVCVTPISANSENKRMLYKKFWRCLAPWEYGKMRITKEARAAREDKRDRMLD